MAAFVQQVHDRASVEQLAEMAGRPDASPVAIMDASDWQSIPSENLVAAFQAGHPGPRITTHHLPPQKGVRRNLFSFIAAASDSVQRTCHNACCFLFRVALGRSGWNQLGRNLVMPTCTPTSGATAASAGAASSWPMRR